MDTRRKHETKLEYLWVKAHRAMRSTSFLRSCAELKILPAHTWVPKSVLHYVNWSKSRLRQERYRLLNQSLRNKTKEEENKKNNFDLEFSKFCNSFNISESDKFELLFRIKSKVTSRERTRDHKLDVKLSKLTSAKNSDKPQFQVINLTDSIIPKDIISILSKGPNATVGGGPHNISLMANFDGL